MLSAGSSDDLPEYIFKYLWVERGNVHVQHLRGVDYYQLFSVDVLIGQYSFKSACSCHMHLMLGI